MARIQARPSGELVREAMWSRRRGHSSAAPHSASGEGMDGNSSGTFTSFIVPSQGTAYWDRA